MCMWRFWLRISSGIKSRSSDLNAWAPCIHMYVHTYTHTYTHAYIHTYTHIPSKFRATVTFPVPCSWLPLTRTTTSAFRRTWIPEIHDKLRTIHSTCYAYTFCVKILGLFYSHRSKIRYSGTLRPHLHCCTERPHFPHTATIPVAAMYTVREFSGLTFTRHCVQTNAIPSHALLCGTRH